MDETLNKKIDSFKAYIKELTRNEKMKIVIDMMHNETMYNFFDDLYLKTNITKDQVYNELTEKLELSVNDEQENKIKRYIDYFFEILKTKYENTSYEELLNKV